MVSEEREIPSLEEIAAVDRQRQQAMEVLEINETDNTAKCQKCGNAIPMIDGSVIPKSNRNKITMLEFKVKYFEDHKNKDEEIKVKQELADIQAENAKHDKFRRLTLHSTKISNFLFVCDSCFDKCEKAYERRKKRLIEKFTNKID
jgi:hypothetical protein